METRVATYRLQLHADFRFEDAAAIADYLAELGVSHLYLSPVLQAAKGSTHGYDVVDPSRLSDELGGEKGWRVLLERCASVGLGRLVDIVPNHMAITGPDNAWWWDVLENGANSVYAAYFDVEWHPESPTHDQVLLPILGDHYGRELEAGRFELQRHGAEFVVSYFDHVVPVNPRSLDTVLGGAATRLDDGGALGPRAMLEYLATALGRLPRANSTDTVSVAERHRDKQILAARLGELCVDHPEVAAAIDAQLAATNSNPDALDALLARQNYRLAWWRTAAEELDYRRFFDINDLAAIRVEDPEVFADSHRLALGWLAAGEVDGLRIDHVDGLWDPTEYLRRLVTAAPGAWVVVEKILAASERLPASWPVAGTTGYDWLALLDGVLIDPAGARMVEHAYRAFTEDEEPYADLVARCKREVLDGPLNADLTRLVGRLATICRHHRRYRDYTRRDLSEAVSEIVAAFGVYRTYVSEGAPAAEVDVAVIDAALGAVRARRPDLDGELLDFVGSLLAGRLPGVDEGSFTHRAQQLTAPVMAKGVEDTAFYRYVALTARNEVGGDPGGPVVEPEEFGIRAQGLQEEHPHGLLATSTHDTKRAEDVRARLAVLAEIPDEWAAAVHRWAQVDRPGRVVGGIDRPTEWLLYQTLFGAWPLTPERLSGYLEKAVREAKAHTSWTDPDTGYEDAVQSFAAHCLADAGFVGELAALVGRFRRPAWSNGLAQKLLTLTGPGVPDLYQGSELWDLSLVDPDNRRPVDYRARRVLLERVAGADAAALWAAEDGDGGTKLAVVLAALAVRRDHPAAFGPGAAGRYQPLVAQGPAARHALAAGRGDEVVTVATRLPVGLQRLGGWGDTTLALPPGQWSSRLGPGTWGRLGGGTWEGDVSLSDLLGGLPVALLVAA